jgi:4-amino-4-deoxy-L-arabinose transferase-like glycosyltransferase
VPGRYHVLIVAVLTGILLLSSLYRGGLSGYDDALYAHEAKEMVLHGDWWNVHFNGYLNFEYPPMFLWLDAISMSWLGTSDFAAKLPSALAGIGSVAALYFLATELTGDAWFGIFSMLVLATTQPFLKYATHAMTDVPFTFLFTLSLLSCVKGLRRPWFLLLAGLFIGLGILTRSVIGLLPIAIMALHLVVNRRWRLLWSPQAMGGLLIALLLPLLWAGSQYRLHGAEFLGGHFSFISRKVHASGSATAALDAGAYAKYLLKYYWPWLPVFLAGLVFDVRALRTKWLAPLWLAVAILPITQAETAYGRYLMPAFPAMAMLGAVALERWIASPRRELFFRGACALMLALGVYTILFAPPERGMGIRTLAPLAEKYSRPGQRLLLYTNGELRFDYQNQLLWYTDRYVDLIANPAELRRRNAPGAVVVMDRASFAALPTESIPVRVLGRDEDFVCYREGD